MLTLREGQIKSASCYFQQSIFQFLKEEAKSVKKRLLKIRIVTFWGILNDITEIKRYRCVEGDNGSAPC